MGFVDGVSLGFVVIDVADGHDPDALELAVLEELEGLAQQGPTEIELESALAQSERAWLSALASQEERADLISQHALLHGDPHLVNTYLDRLRAVSARQVQDAAAQWLRPSSRVVVAHLVDSQEDAA